MSQKIPFEPVALTKNGFTVEFEDQVLAAKEEPFDESDVFESAEDLIADLRKSIKNKE